jgi:hypothetical protein
MVVLFRAARVAMVIVYWNVRVGNRDEYFTCRCVGGSCITLILWSVLQFRVRGVVVVSVQSDPQIIPVGAPTPPTPCSEGCILQLPTIVKKTLSQL